MSPKIEELLKLLDDEKALALYLDDNGYSEYVSHDTQGIYPGDPPRLSLTSDIAVLAFRLRDRAVKDSRANWRRAQHLVVSEAAEIGEAPPLALPETWWADFAQPKHVIVAALIAQELGKEAKTSSKLSDLLATIGIHNPHNLVANGHPFIWRRTREPRACRVAAWMLSIKSKQFTRVAWYDHGSLSFGGLAYADSKAELVAAIAKANEMFPDLEMVKGAWRNTYVPKCDLEKAIAAAKEISP